MGFGSFFSNIAPLALTAVGSAVGGPIGGMLGGAIGSGISGMAGAQQSAEAMNAQNQFNFNAMVDENNFSAQQAAIQRNYQTQMANTVYQRGAKDMQAAGLNPMLAAGAPDPMASGAMAANASMGNAQAIPSVAGGISNSARDALNLVQSMRESNARILNTQADTNFTKNVKGPVQMEQGEVLDQNKNLLMKQNQILDSELSAINAHPTIFGYLKALNDRGVNASSAMSMMGALDLIP